MALKCVICGQEAEYIHGGLSLCKKHFKWAIQKKRIEQAENH